MVAGALKLHRVLAINMAPTSTSAMKLDSQKAKEWVDLIVGSDKSTFFLKSHFVIGHLVIWDVCNRVYSLYSIEKLIACVVKTDS